MDRERQIAEIDDLLQDEGMTELDGKSTDHSRAGLFAERYSNDLRYCAPWDKWLVWTGTHWRIDDRLAVEDHGQEFIQELHRMAARADNAEERRLLGHAAQALESRQKRQIMILDARCKMTVPVEWLDADPWALNVANGTLNLRTGKLQPHTRRDFITKIVDVAYDPSATCPIFDRFLYEIFRGDEGLIQFVQRAVGYSLTGSTIEHVLFLLFGIGSNGKTTFVMILKKLLGPLAIETPPKLLLSGDRDRHPTELARLRGARLATCSEFGKESRFSPELVKRLTGGDQISARMMHEDFWDFEPTHTFWICTNHLPRVRDDSHATWRRMRVVPFNVTFHDPGQGTPEKDKGLPDKLTNELPGILAWAVRGCLAWRKEGLGHPESVRTATNAYRQREDCLHDFLEQLDGEWPIKSSTLYGSYKAWCEEAGETPISQRFFSQDVESTGFEKKPKKDGVYFYPPKRWWVVEDGATFPLNDIESVSRDKPEVSSTIHHPPSNSEWKNTLCGLKITVDEFLADLSAEKVALLRADPRQARQHGEHVAKRKAGQ